MIKNIIIVVAMLLLSGCGTLDSKTININVGDSKEAVVGIMGPPQDRQLKDIHEAWQYCVSGAGFGYNDHKIIWFTRGLVSGISSYRSSGSGCTGFIKTVRWEDAPDVVVETRSR